MWAMVTLFLVTPLSTQNGVMIDKYESQATCEADLPNPDDVVKMETAFTQLPGLKNNAVKIVTFCIPEDQIQDVTTGGEPK